MSALTVAWHVLVALLIGVVVFFLGLFLPLWTLMLVGKDPGNIGGGLLTVGIGAPLGSACGVFAGIFWFRKLRSWRETVREVPH
jgi:hypothetical protein